ncbi:MAG: glycosyltransferase family 2 protein [Calditrichia bacterium]|nr:glycosyltransferase family 2 protein [Calditrichia bacterium]
MNQIKKQKIALLIPVFNEEGSICKVLADIPLNIVDEIVVVDNGSTDTSAQIAKSFGATVLSQHIRGYGAACLKGIDYLKSQSPQPDLLVFLDGDYSDYPEETANLVEKINEGHDFVLGSRVLGIEYFNATLSSHSVLGNKLAAFFLKYLFGGNYTDLGPFRIIKFDKLLQLQMADMNYGWTMEMQIKALRHKLIICEIPVRYRERFAGESKVTGTFWGSVKAFIKITYIVIQYFFRIK